jgi:hypothetical protein
MDPLLTNRLDPALRIVEKHGGDYEPPPRRRRLPVPTKPAVEEESIEPTAHQIDDLA